MLDSRSGALYTAANDFVYGGTVQLDQVKMIRYQSGSWSGISPLLKAR